MKIEVVFVCVRRVKVNDSGAECVRVTDVTD